MVNLKAKKLVLRLHTRVKVSIKPLPLPTPLFNPIEICQPIKLTPEKAPRKRKEQIYYEYKLIEKRLSKKLAAKGMLLHPIIYDCEPLQQQAIIVKIKGGFMDNIGEIIDSNYNTITLPKNNLFNL